MTRRHFEVYHPTDWTPPEGSWASSGTIRRTMVKCRNRDTSPELLLRRAVHRIGLRYRVAGRPLPTIRRTADLVFSRARVAVFMDGCFWHQCPQHFVMPRTNEDYWRAKIGRNRDRDRETDEALAAAGWRVIRVWEHEGAESAAEQIAEAVRRK